MLNHSAAPATRALAMAIDGLLWATGSAVLMWIVYGDPVSRWDDMRPGTLAINWLLPLLVCVFFWTWQGATPGKLIAGVKVVDAQSGGKPTPVQALLRWFGYLISTLPLFAGFWWAKLDPHGRTWHDRLSGTAVERSRPLPASGRGLLADYVSTHWHGEQSLAQSFWINNLLLAFPLMGALTGLMSWIGMKGDALQAGSIAMLIGWPLMLAVDTWCVVGGWRSVRGYLDANGSLLWAFLARVIMFLGAVQILASLAIGFIPQVPEFWKMARGIDPIGQAVMTVSEDGHTLHFQGPIGMGDARRMGKLLEGAPAVKSFELASPGGRLAEAEDMVVLMRKRGANVRAVGDCQSACTLLFLAGVQRQLMPGAQLGFHRASTGTFNAAFDEIANQHLAETYRKMELPEDFIQRTLKTSSRSMWYPSPDDLLRHQLIQEPPKTLDVALPDGPKPGEPAPLAEYVAAFKSNPVWYHLNERFPGALNRAATQMRNARQALAGSEQEADGAQMAAQMAITAEVKELVLSGSAESRRRYLQVVRGQMRAMQALGADTCQAWLAGSPATRRLMPADVMAWETSWLANAAQEDAPSRTRAGEASRLELEVVHRTLGPQAPGLLSHLWSADATGDTTGVVTCERATQLLDQIQRLKVAPRELAERVVFQTR
ncbi:RDD family protein [Roseateles sp. YR242]|uniref:RDD family protein n=1 Tax=Roseateles sp. YR242 TaxID=1855305 RepID=UPI0008D30F04|nr:RDD family protein [Roseateles sp. YR242]SEK79950.1 RDD family protein [Roseateles sp. YR242]